MTSLGLAFAFVLYLCTMVFSYRHDFPSKSGRFPRIIFLFLGNFILWQGILLLPNSALRAFGVLFIMNLNIMIFYKVSFKVSLYVAGIYHISAYCVRGFLFSCLALYTQNNVASLFLQPAVYNMINIIAFIIAALEIYCVRRYLIKPRQIMYLLENKQQLQFLVTYMYVLVIYLLLVNDGRVLDLESNWFSYLYILSSLFSQVLLLYILKHVATMSEHIAHELVEKQIIGGLEAKLEFYQNYQQQSLTLTQFKHDFSNIMHSINHFVDNKDFDRLSLYLEDITGVVSSSEIKDTKFCNHDLIDAILQSTAQRCKAENITFEALVQIPPLMTFNDLDIIRIFTNLLDNAFEACLKVSPEQKRFIRIKGIERLSWVSFEISNSYNTALPNDFIKYNTTKKDSENHGHGRTIVTQTVAQLKGVLVNKINPETSVFSTVISLPILS